MKYVFFLLLSLTCLNVSAAELNKLKFLTESYPPYNYRESGKIVGLSVDVLNAASKAVGDPVKKIELQPWVRGYKSAISGPMVVLFSTTRNKERESKFKWAGPISSTEIVVLAKKSKNIKISNPKDFDKYAIGVVREDIGQQLLTSLGVIPKSIKAVSRPDMIIKQLEHDRVDMIAYENNVAKTMMTNAGMTPSDYETVYVLSKSFLYFAFSLDTPNEYVSKLQKGIDLIESNGKLESIKSKY
ncbi:ABC transporter substrate-binding protein [Vibrio profundum]|uniref:substrate-binding periplasmic protein n=1 Tax=Vibrio profundum TaxID=2910247 RepID=UPI003D128408